MNTTLLALIALQRLDKQIFEMRQRIESIPAKLKQLDELLAERHANVARIRANIEDQERTRRLKEQEIETNTEHVKKYQGQLVQVKTNKEYTALLGEINAVKSKNGLIEDDILELMESVERARNGLKSAQEELAQTELRVAQEKQQQAKEQQEWQQCLAQKEQLRATQAQEIGGAILREYTRLLQVRNGMAVTAVAENGICCGCRVALRPQMFAEVKNGDVLHRCPVCFRFLYSADAEANENAQ